MSYCESVTSILSLGYLGKGIRALNSFTKKLTARKFKLLRRKGHGDEFPPSSVFLYVPSFAFSLFSDIFTPSASLFRWELVPKPGALTWGSSVLVFLVAVCPSQGQSSNISSFIPIVFLSMYRNCNIIHIIHFLILSMDIY